MKQLFNAYNYIILKPDYKRLDIYAQGWDNNPYRVYIMATLINYMSHSQFKFILINTLK